MNGLTLRTPADVLSAVPYLFGFHPSDSVVVLALRGKEFACQVRADTPPPGATAALAAHLVDALLAHRATGVLVVGYGPAAPTLGALTVLEAAFEVAGVPVVDAIRAHGGRYWRHGCDDTTCCPPEGVPYDPSVTEFAASATYAGMAALPTRADVVARLGPVDAPGMAAALGRAVARSAALPGPASRRRRSYGRAAVAEALDRQAAGGRLDDDEVAWLALLLTDVRVRDDTWRRAVDDGPTAVHRELWRDVLRRVPEPYVPAPATLFGLCAWRAGDLVTAGIAVERARTADPGYRLADLLGQAMLAGLSPALLDDGTAPATGRRRPRPRVPAG